MPSSRYRPGPLEALLLVKRDKLSTTARVGAKDKAATDDAAPRLKFLLHPTRPRIPAYFQLSHPPVMNFHPRFEIRLFLLLHS